MNAPRAPVTADWDGVATPRKMRPRVRKTISPKGTTYTRVSYTRRPNGGRSTAYAGARSFWIDARVTM